MIGSSTLSIATLGYSVPTDAFVVGGLAISLMLIAMYAGSSQVISISLAALLAHFLVTFVPDTAFLSALDLSSGSMHTGVFLALFIPLILLLRWMTHDVLAFTTPLQAFMAGIAGTVILLIVWLATPSLLHLWNPSPAIQSVLSNSYRLWIIIAAFVILSFSRT